MCALIKWDNGFLKWQQPHRQDVPAPQALIWKRSPSDLWTCVQELPVQEQLLYPVAILQNVPWVLSRGQITLGHFLPPFQWHGIRRDKHLHKDLTVIMQCWEKEMWYYDYSQGISQFLWNPILTEIVCIHDVWLQSIFKNFLFLMYIINLYTDILSFLNLE